MESSQRRNSQILEMRSGNNINFIESGITRVNEAASTSTPTRMPILERHLSTSVAYQCSICSEHSGDGQVCRICREFIVERRLHRNVTICNHTEDAVVPLRRCNNCWYQKCLQKGMVIDETAVSESFQVHEVPCAPEDLEVTPSRFPSGRDIMEGLVEMDCLDRLINLSGLRIPISNCDISPACSRISTIGNEIIEQLVEWTKILPFFNDIPVVARTYLLTQRWAELTMISACHYACMIYNPDSPVSTTAIDENDEISFTDPMINLQILQNRLTAVLGKQVSLEHVIKEAGQVVMRFTALLNSFSKLNLSPEAYICVKIITLLNMTQPSTLPTHVVKKVTALQDHFVKTLQINLMHPENQTTLAQILEWLPELRNASSVLLHSKMFYVPLLLCKNPRKLVYVE